MSITDAGQLQILADTFDKWVGKNPKIFKLGQPAQLTVKKPDFGGKIGGYSKRAYIGDERFKIVSVYAGKRDGLIACLKHADGLDAEIKHVEIPVEKAKTLLNGFLSYWQEFESSMELEATNTAKSFIAERDRDDRIYQPQPTDADFYGEWS